MKFRMAIVAVLLAIMVSSLAAFQAPAVEGTVRAISAWRGEGQYFQVGPNQAFFQGVFRGIMFIENEDPGPLDAARITCPAMVQIDADKGKQSGEGRCIITGPLGNQVFARFTCNGETLQACEGTFELTGGTGEFAGVTGESQFRVRSTILELAVDSDSDSVEESSAGIAVWPELKYRIQ